MNGLNLFFKRVFDLLASGIAILSIDVFIVVFLYLKVFVL